MLFIMHFMMKALFFILASGSWLLLEDCPLRMRSVKRMTEDVITVYEKPT
jgi:hypothetical protein